MYYACLSVRSITSELCSFYIFFIELFAKFDSVLILFGIVAAAMVVECYMYKHSHPLTFTKKIAYLVVSNYENNRHDVLYRLIYYSKSSLHVSGENITRNV
jgi:hypothetical protein